MACCNRITKNKKTVKATAQVISTMVKPDEFVTVVYLGMTNLIVTGCYTHNRYWFGQNTKRELCKQDADCLFDRYPGEFISEISSDIASNEPEMEYREPEVN